MVPISVNCTRCKIYIPHSSIFRSILVFFNSHDTKNSNGNNNDNNDDAGSLLERSNNEQNLSLPEPPTTCCMSGCANCVWIEYAEKVTKLFNDGGEQARKHILNNIKDPNMRAFLLSELRNIKK